MSSVGKEVYKQPGERIKWEPLHSRNAGSSSGMSSGSRYHKRHCYREEEINVQVQFKKAKAVGNEITLMFKMLFGNVMSSS